VVFGAVLFLGLISEGAIKRKMKQRKPRPKRSNNGLRRKRRAGKPQWLKELRKTGVVPESPHRDKENWPADAKGHLEADPNYHKYLEEIDETFWCETIGLPISSKAKTSTPVAARKTDTARCLNRLANPQLFPKCKGCKKYENVPVVKKAEHRVCIKCGETKALSSFRGAYEIVPKFIGWCNACVDELVDSTVHPADSREVYIGPPGGTPARQGCLFCCDGLTGKICQFCVSELDRYKPRVIEKLYQLFFNDDVRRELIETYSRITDAAMARVEKEYEGFNQEYFTLTNTGRSIAYKKEKDNGKSKTVGRICQRGENDGLVGNRQEKTDLLETEGVAIHPIEQDGQDVLDEFGIGTSGIAEI
jgi:hypothetical protein